MSTSRVAIGSRREVGILTWVSVRVAGWVAGIEPPKLFLVLGRHRRLFRAWILFASRLMPGGRLPRRETELVILRVANSRHCGYEKAHHEVLARRAGLSREEIQGLYADELPPGFSPREAAIVQAVDAMLAHRDLSDAEWEALHQHLSDLEVIELCMLVGHYDMLATTIHVLGIAPDEPRDRPLSLLRLARR